MIVEWFRKMQNMRNWKQNMKNSCMDIYCVYNQGLEWERGKLQGFAAQLGWVVFDLHEHCCWACAIMTAGCRLRESPGFCSRVPRAVWSPRQEERLPGTRHMRKAQLLPRSAAASPSQACSPAGGGCAGHVSFAGSVFFTEKWRYHLVPPEMLREVMVFNGCWKSAFPWGFLRMDILGDVWNKSWGAIGDLLSSSSRVFFSLASRP